MIPRFKPTIGWEEFKNIFNHKYSQVNAFEKAFAEKFEAVDAVAFPYGRSAQWAFLKALGIKDSEIIMPAYTCSVVAHAVTLSGNVPKFIDIKLDDYNMDLDQLESSISKNTSAVIPTHTFGYPQNIKRIEEAIFKAEKRYNKKIWLIQDCCHAFGAKSDNRLIGTSGDVAVYALNISKMITSVFGGMLTFQSRNLADLIRKWRDENFLKPSKIKVLKRKLYFSAVYPAFNQTLYGLTWYLQNKTKLLSNLTESYHLDEKIHFPPDYLDLMSDFEASVGIEQLNKYSDIINRRISKAIWYNDNLERREGWIFPPITKGATYSHYVVRVPNREKVLDEYASNGIELGKLIQYSIPDLKCYKKESEHFPNAKLCSKQLINFSL